ncbi:MAG: signal peptidase II [Chloroflexi bacterium]|nr:signal peptidase II [Chloroflexota bacterium]
MSDIEPIESEEMAELSPHIVDDGDVVDTAVPSYNTIVIQPDKEPIIERGTIRQQAILFIVGAFVLLLDQISKRWVEVTIPLYQTWEPFPAQRELFRFTHVPNKGVAFGMFQNGGTIFAVVAIVVSIVIVYYNYTLPKGNLTLRLALGLQIGGALGNFTDRLRIGHVTDFLDFGPIPIFNVADTAVVTGAIILGIVVWLESRAESAKAAAARRAAFATSMTSGAPISEAELIVAESEIELNETTNEMTPSVDPIDELEPHNE